MIFLLHKTQCPKKLNFKSSSLRHPALHSGVEAKTGARDQGLLMCRLLPALRSPTWNEGPINVRTSNKPLANNKGTGSWLYTRLGMTALIPPIFHLESANLTFNIPWRQQSSACTPRSAAKSRVKWPHPVVAQSKNWAAAWTTWGSSRASPDSLASKIDHDIDDLQLRDAQSCW